MREGRSTPRVVALFRHAAELLRSQSTALFLERFSAEERVIRQVCAQTIRIAQIGFEIPEAVEDGREAIKDFASVERCLGQFIGGHMPGLKSGMVKAVVRVQPPFAIEEQALLGLQALVKPGTRIRQGNIESRKCEF